MLVRRMNCHTYTSYILCQSFAVQLYGGYRQEHPYLLNVGFRYQNFVTLWIHY